MNRSQILLSLVLKEAEVPISVKDFDNRLLVQKAVYLLQNAGVQLGYPYNWYVRGPYSSRLANDLFCLVGMQEPEKGEMERYALGEDTKTNIKKIKSLLGREGDLPHRAKTLELLASVLFLIKTKQAKSFEYQRLSEILRANGKQFDSLQTENAVNQLHSYGYAF